MPEGAPKVQAGVPEETLCQERSECGGDLFLERLSDKRRNSGEIHVGR